MASAPKRLAVIATMLCFAAGMAVAQDEQPAATPQTSSTSPSFGFKLGIGIGVQTFNDTTPPTTWQSLSVFPDISFGKLGVGLALAINYNFSGGSGNSLAIRQEDWWPTNEPVTFQNVLAIYLPKIAYVRWGEKGDPLFLKLGSFNDATLGDGFIMGDYNNILFLPTQRHFGLQADVDGSLFNFPYVGLESVFGNLAQLDVMGARVYVRPFVGTSIPILDNLQVGATAAVDTTPYFNTVSAQNGLTASPLGAFGADVMVPLVNTKDVFSLVAFTDFSTIQGMTWGSMVGVGGRIITIFTYGAQLRLLGHGFIPSYFGPSYDVRETSSTRPPMAGGSGTTFGGLLSLGTSLLGDKLIFKVTFDTPFVTTETDPLLSNPHLNGILSLVTGSRSRILLRLHVRQEGNRSLR